MCSTHGVSVAAQASTPLGHIILTLSKPVGMIPVGSAIPGQLETEAEQALGILYARIITALLSSLPNAEAPVKGCLMFSRGEKARSVRLVRTMY